MVENIIQDAQLEWCDQHHVSSGGALSYQDLADFYGKTPGAMRGLLRRYRGRKRKGAVAPIPEPPPSWSGIDDGIGRQEPLKRDETENTLVIEATTEGVKSLKDLLEAASVDLDVWHVDRYIVNKWPVGMKDDAGGALVIQLFQVKAWLVRKEPVPIFPHLQPIAPQITFSMPPQPSAKGIQRSLVVADTHIGLTRHMRTGDLSPFHDYRVMSLIFQLAEAVKPDRIDVLGDLVDLSEWTDKYLRTPEFFQTTQPAVLIAHWFLSRLRHIRKRAVIKLHQGNHEDRIDKMLLIHLKAAHGLKAADEMHLPPALSIQRLLALHKLGIGWVGAYPNDVEWLNDRLLVRHGESFGKTAAKNVAERTDGIEVFGHGHSRQRYARTMHLRDGPKVVEGYCPGCACHIDGRVPGHRHDQAWQQGIAIVDFEVDGEMVHIDSVPIEEGRAIWNGQLFQAEDLLPQIQEDLPGWRWA